MNPITLSKKFKLERGKNISNLTYIHIDMPQEVKAIIFDLGNVLISYSHEFTFKKWAALTNFTIDYFREHYCIDEELIKYEKGQISNKEYYEYVTKMLDIEWSYDIFETGWNSIHLGVDPEILTLILKLKTNYRLFILTNTNNLHSSFWRTHFQDLLHHFEKIFCSFELNLHKPDPDIYQTVLNDIKLLPSEVIFIDDKFENIQGAERIGIPSILFNSSSQLIHDLNFLINI